MKALLDGDLYAFRPAAASENDDLGIAIARCEEMIDQTLSAVSADEFVIYLSGSNNFRYDIYPEYKANRTAPKPRHLQGIKDHLIATYDAIVSDGCEADDLLGIAQCSSDVPTVICSLDKDLRMIPGNHYSFEIRGTSSLGKEWVRPAEFVTVSEYEGLKHFYTQLLVGDPADNIKGAAGIGKVKAERILKDCRTEQEMFEAVQSCFSSDEELLMLGRCLWIWRKELDDWKSHYENLYGVYRRKAVS